MAQLVYAACALTSILCAVLLFRSYRSSKARLLFWSCLCFVGLALNNILLFVDLVLTPPTTDLSMARNAIALAAMCSLLFGLIWDSE